MSRFDEVLDVEVLNEPKSTDLVPLAPRAPPASSYALPHADPSFITHLIATAVHAPQTCKLRRGSAEDAQIAYGPHPCERRSVARRTRRVI